MSMLKEFKEFAVKGNVVDMAVGIIIGAAFGKIVSSFVNDVIMPPIGMLMGNVDFTRLFINLGSEDYATLAEATKAAAPVIRYGQFLQVTLDFLIVAFAVFIMVKAINKMKRKEEAKEEATQKAPQTSEEILLLREIRDSLKK